MAEAIGCFSWERGSSGDTCTITSLDKAELASCEVCYNVLFIWNLMDLSLPSLFRHFCGISVNDPMKRELKEMGLEAFIFYEVSNN
ncbi:unnamed protein product [Musa acuminata var. zebrina]